VICVGNKEVKQLLHLVIPEAEQRLSGIHRAARMLGGMDSQVRNCAP
jgi:hypothetical protein